MAERQPEIGDRVLYRGRYRKVVGWQQEPGGPVTEERGPVIAYQNPETERNTYNREEDLAYSEHFGAHYPVGLLLSRAECVVYAALPGLPGSDVPRVRQHEQAARLLETADLDPEALGEEERETAKAKIAGYWPDGERDVADVFAEARELVTHRQEEG